MTTYRYHCPTCFYRDDVVSELSDGQQLMYAGPDGSTPYREGHRVGTLPRIAIRSHTYRGEAGYLVQDVSPLPHRRGLFGTSIFASTRSAAEHIRSKLKEGQEIVLEDWNV